MRTVIESLHLPSGRSIDPASQAPGRRIVLPLGERSVTLAFTALSPDYSPSAYFRYRMSPRQDWIDDGTLNLHQFAREGMRLAGRLADVAGNQLFFADDLHANLTYADQFEAGTLKAIDAYIEKTGAPAPSEPVPLWRDGFHATAPQTLDLASIDSVVWATGYDFDFNLVELAVTDDDGYPVQHRGISPHQGLYFVGLPWLHRQRSGLISGVGEDAAYLAEHICMVSEAEPA